MRLLSLPDNAATIWDLPLLPKRDCGVLQPSTMVVDIDTTAGDWEEFDNSEKLATWLRWANPDDGWQYCDSRKHCKFKARFDNSWTRERSERTRENSKNFAQRYWFPSRKIARGNPGLVAWHLASPTAKITRFSSHRDSGQPIPFHPKIVGEYFKAEELSRRVHRK